LLIRRWIIVSRRLEHECKCTIRVYGSAMYHAFKHITDTIPIYYPSPTLEMPSLPPYGDLKRPAIAWSIAATACTANFLDIFQASMVLFGLSPIAEDLAFTPYDINWVIVAYTITFATFLLFAGQFADRWGVRNVFLVSAFAPNQQALLAGRALAGVGAAFTVCIFFG
jgi:hypothetical protein